MTNRQGRPLRHKRLPSFKSHFNDYTNFLKAWCRAPLRTGAIAPSSVHLARAMAFAAAPRLGSKVIELGPGTGIVTQAVLELGIAENDLILIELNPDFSARLKQQFPRATIITGDAFQLLANQCQLPPDITAIVSSLPLFVYEKPLRQSLGRHALAITGAQGRLVQFTYSPLSPIPLEKSMRANKSRLIWNNVPPACVWTYQNAF